MIKKVCVCDRCKKEVSDSIFEVSINGITLNSPFGLNNIDVAASNIAERFVYLKGFRHLCSECREKLNEFLKGAET